MSYIGRHWIWVKNGLSDLYHWTTHSIGYYYLSGVMKGHQASALIRCFCWSAGLPLCLSAGLFSKVSRRLQLAETRRKLT